MSATSTYTTAIDAGNENAVVAELAREAAAPVPIDAGHCAAHLIPAGAELRIIETEAFRDVPDRPRGTVKPGTVEALLAYCKGHDTQTTEIWVNTERIVAVLNGAGGDAEHIGWRDHRAELNLQHSPEWRHWISRDGRMVSQAEFSEHIEEGLIDIVEPDSATMLEIAQHFQVTRNAAFRSSQHLQSGRLGFLYDESDTATKGGQSGQFEIPNEFQIGIPVYEGEECYRITARFRYRVNDGNLTLGYKLDRPDVVKRDAAEQIAERIRGAEFTRVYHGEPSGAVSPGLL
jgi:uncharacterized protein YfdQ (DUF2303 family)